MKIGVESAVFSPLLEVSFGAGVNPIFHCFQAVTSILKTLVLLQIKKLESVAITNALQREGRPTLRQSLYALITTPMPSLKSLSLSVVVL